ncbi:Atu2307/SP_0267 family LLM class monooxygenase [Liquorilactobacillus mali]|nr:Atu2307/SP_0267 family LLM class monooxygenase [Liquorilactobacillus mali]EJE99950.1 putative oxidoreductase [Liquorilactobacillus mali KCTC 3596 = DSM 20444]MDC7954148.1 LLM class flavin-dependent oxidoreductase [Liquorilactobacillus mali]QFQ73764.1 LLM class flavin-dependent oxidoreductase [Liquorilactobacillus mali]
MIKPEELIFGLDSFGDIPQDEDGKSFTQAEAIRQVVKEAKMADELGIDVIALGEHHRVDYAISSPDTVLAAIASITKKITLATGVTVLSSDDPVRVYERFATLEAISRGRAEAVLGRGSFTESFPLFGYDLQNYDILFEEKLNLYSKLLEEKPVTWEGTTRAALKDADVFPKTDNGKIATRIAVGGSPESVVRTARYGFPLTLAIIGGSPERFSAYIELYKKAAAKFEQPVYPVAVHSHGVIADTDEEAIELGWNHIRASFVRIGQDRGWTPMSREQYEGEVQNGSFYVGSPETVAKRIARMIKILGIGRFELVYGAGGLSANARERTIELYATKVIPRVRELLSEG